MATQKEEASTDTRRGVRVRESATINRPVGEVFAFWENFSNLPLFMRHLESVRTNESGRSRWRARKQDGASEEWDVEVVEVRPDELISWRIIGSPDDADVSSARFRRAAGGRGTEVTVELNYDQPGGRIGATLAKLFGKGPGLQAHGDLRRFKQLMETGEIVHSDASIHSKPHPASPSDPAEDEPNELQQNPQERLVYRVVERSADAASTTSSNLDHTTRPRPEPRFESGLL